MSDYSVAHAGVLLGTARIASAVTYAAAVVPLLIGLIACQGSQPRAEGRGLLPPPPKGDLTGVSAATRPFNEGFGEAAVARTVLRTPGPSGVEIRIRDAIIGPNGTAQLSTASGPVLIDTRSGVGRAEAAGKVIDLSTQRPVSFPAGVTTVLANTAAVPLVLRIYMLEGR